MVCGFAFAFVACGGGAKKDEAAQDTTKVADTTAVAPADSAAADTAAAK